MALSGVLDTSMLTFKRFLESKDMPHPDYVDGWDDLVPAFRKWTRTDMTPEQWARRMLDKLASQRPGSAREDRRLQGTRAALESFLKNGKLDPIGTTGHYSNDPDATPFSPN